MASDELIVFGGSGSPKLAAAVCDYLGSRPGRGETLRFSEGNTFVRVLENVRGRDVFIVQSVAYPA
ncbi:MAG: ribose-phosphate pyrophosphokinase-like domain-containing protein, partial [Candidatus Binatia bacterium]